MERPVDAREIPGYPGYWVTPDARLWNDKTKKCHSGSSDGRYWRVWVIENGQRKKVKLHRLVCLAFHGLPPEGKPWALHKDDDKSNNHESNLRWGNQIDNVRDSFDNGSFPLGVNNGKSRFNECQIRAMRLLHAHGVPYPRIAEIFKSNRVNVRLICLRKMWAHVV